MRDDVENWGSGQKLRLEVVPMDPRRSVPGGVVHDEQLPHALLFERRLGQFINEKLQHVGVHPVDGQAEESPALRCHAPITFWRR